MSERTASKTRRTSESSVDLEINLDGTGRSSIDTTVPFFDHMLTAFAKHSLTDLTVRAAGDTHIDALRLVRLPYHLSALTQAAATAALGHADTMLGMVDEIVSQRDRISATVEALGYQAHESWTNFVLFGGVADPAATWQALYDRGVLIRDIGIPHHLRVTAGTADETTAFLDALASIGSGS